MSQHNTHRPFARVPQNPKWEPGARTQLESDRSKACREHAELVCIIEAYDRAHGTISTGTRNISEILRWKATQHD